jgi:hypothetical protein
MKDNRLIAIASASASAMRMGNTTTPLVPIPKRREVSANVLATNPKGSIAANMTKGSARKHLPMNLKMGRVQPVPGISRCRIDEGLHSSATSTWYTREQKGPSVLPRPAAAEKDPPRASYRCAASAFLAAWFKSNKWQRMMTNPVRQSRPVYSSRGGRLVPVSS